MIKPAAFPMKTTTAPKRVRIVLAFEGGFLLERLSNPKWPMNLGKTRFIGGKIELGETPAQAAARELFEELGVHAKPEQFRSLGHYEHQEYFALDAHNIVPGVYEASVGPDPFINLIVGSLDDPDYIGPTLEALNHEN
jgi:8-oxo-dGTP pyrophosphatase MutT (NUDIX family)